MQGSAELRRLLYELRDATDETLSLLKIVIELSDEAPKAETAASELTELEGRTEPTVVPAPDLLNETYGQYTLACKKWRNIWDRARKPILAFAMNSEHGSNVLAEFHRLPETPMAGDLLRYVEFLEIILDTRLPEDSTVEQDHNAKPGDTKRRGRPVQIPEERKASALQLKRSGGTDLDAAKILYGTNQPSKRQCDNVHAVLASYRRKYGLDGPPA
jgi:hypothetical protein